MVGGEQLQQHVLRVVRVLVLVDEDVAEPLLIVLQDRRKGLEELDGQHDDVVEVDGGGLDETLLVEAIDVRHLLVIEPRPVLLERLEVDELVLGVRDGSLDLARREPLGVHVEIAHTEGDEPQ